MDKEANFDLSKSFREMYDEGRRAQYEIDMIIAENWPNVTASKIREHYADWLATRKAEEPR